jgi:hypothetical protein
MPGVMMLTPMARLRMALGDILQSISIRSIASNVSGLGSYISTYFESTATQPQYKTNREWNDLINKNANGMFWVYYQNVHGVPVTMPHWDKIFKTWLPSKSGACASLKQILIGTILMSSKIFCQGNERYGNMQPPSSHPLTWSHHQNT